ncbi:unnamed protein product [Porites evermanni]|uniref:Uncharacterized protein n=2 Tax=Porites TaxID=46719 RepID=A0ABN8PFR4_9CNID|nr:unnamed protein product [Porites lobata]CAH3189338.1 unnamed protein product [Porites evermanni]
MFYKHNSFSGRVSQADAAAAYQPQGLGTYKEVSVKGPVIEPPNFNMSSASSGANEVTKWQEIYKKTKAPVYLLRGGRDQVMFRGLLVAIGGGMCYTFYNMYLMFTNQLKKKER